MTVPSEIRSGGGHDGAGHPELVDMLLTLDWKVSLIMKRLISESRPDLFPFSGVMYEVSGGGMRLMTGHGLESGNLIEIDMVLPVVPFHNMFIKGEVVQVRKVNRASETDAFEVGVAFRDVNELQLDHLAKYALKRQMALQRERRAS
jgi:c-di-GMP-binding flagellar brake protein YcgR